MYKDFVRMDITLSDLNELERELIENIERFDAPEKVSKRIARLVSNRISLYRAVLHVDRMVKEEKEKNGIHSKPKIR